MAEDHQTMTKEQLLLKAEGVRDCVKWMESELKKENKKLEEDKKLRAVFGMYDDCGESYCNAVDRREARISCMIEVKVSMEKYMRKLKHLAMETTS